MKLECFVIAMITIIIINNIAKIYGQYYKQFTSLLTYSQQDGSWSFLNNMTILKQCIQDSLCYDKQLTPYCKIKTSCCLTYLNSSFTEIIETNYTNYNCQLFVEGSNITYFRPVINQCSDSYNINLTVKYFCENPDKQTILFDELYQTTIDVNYNIYYNRFCAICNQATAYKIIPVFMNCSENEISFLENANVSLNERMKFYYINCTRILLKNMLEGYPTFSEKYYNYNSYSKSLGICDQNQTDLLQPITNKIEFIQILCKISEITPSAFNKNMFCDILQNKMRAPLCTNPNDVDLESGFNNFQIPSFATLIDFRKPSRLFVSYNEIEREKEYCSLNKTVKLIENHRINLEFCLIKNCKNIENFNELAKRCEKIDETVKIIISFDPSTLNNIFQYFTLLDVICDFLKTEYTSFILNDLLPDCIEKNQKFGSYILNFGIKYPLINKTKFQFAYDDKENIKKLYLIVQISNKTEKELFLDASTESLSQLLQAHLLKEVLILREGMRSLLHITIEYWEIIKLSQLDKVQIQKFQKNLYPKNLTNWIEIENNKSIYPIDCHKYYYSIFKENKINKETVLQLMNSQLNIDINDNLILDGNTLIHWTCSHRQELLINFIDKYSIINSWINLIVIPISICGLICTIYTYLNFKSMRNLSGICTINLSICLLLNYIIFYILSLLKEKRAGIFGCKIGAIFNHYIALCVFTWSFCTAIEAHLTLTRKTSKIKLRNKKLFIIGYVIPLIYILLCLIGYLCKNCFGKLRVEYVDYSGLCWLASGNSILFAMTIPAAFCFISTLSIFIWTINGLISIMKETSRVTSKYKQNYLIAMITVKLSVLLGLVWLFPSLNIVIQSGQFDIFCNIMLASQGILVACCFLSTPKARKFFHNTPVYTFFKKSRQSTAIYIKEIEIKGME